MQKNKQNSFIEKAIRIDKCYEEMENLKHQFKIEDQLNFNFEFKVNLENGLEKKIVEKLTCLICLKIVNNPLKCGNCSKLFCDICINNLIKNEDSCPNCSCSPFKIEKIDTFIKYLLDESEFICPLGCGKNDLLSNFNLFHQNIKKLSN